MTLKFFLKAFGLSLVVFILIVAELLIVVGAIASFSISVIKVINNSE